jgi:hypothetical protein
MLRAVVEPRRRISDCQTAAMPFPAAYIEAVKRAAAKKNKPQLVALDAWFFSAEYRDELAAAKCMSLAQLEKTMEWKLTRGQYRPTLLALIRQNSDAAVKAASRTAFAAETPAAFVKALCELRGVGPATASALGTVLRPSEMGFFSDEAFAAVMKTPPKYSFAEFCRYNDAIVAAAAAEKSSAQFLEMRFWAAAYPAAQVAVPSKASATASEKKLKAKKQPAAEKTATKKKKSV